MPKTRQQKEEILNKLVEDLKSSKAVTLTSFSELPVNEDQKLRQEFYDQKIGYGVVKKTLLRKAFDKLGHSEADFDSLTNNISVAISQEDEVAPAKISEKFSSDNESFDIVGGILENKWIDKNGVIALAKLPSKEELIAKTVGTIKAPLSGFVNVLAGNARGLVNVLNAIKDKK